MTKHNLKTHLSWLLNAKPFVPPADQHIVLPASDFPGSQGSTPGPADLTGDVLTREASRSQPIVPNFRPHAFKSPAIESAALGSTLKARLISNEHPERTPVPGASSGVKERLAAASSESSKRRYNPVGATPRGYAERSKGKNYLRLQKELSEEWDMADIEAIDLTGDSDTRTGSSPSVHVPVSKSRKRKSDQFEVDLEDSPARRRPRVQSGPSRSLARDEFVPVENFEDPPPPYSTGTQKSAAPPAEHHSIFENEDFGELQLLSAQFKAPLANTIPKNIINIPSKASSSLLTKEERQLVTDFAGWPEACLLAVCKGLDTEVQQLRAAQTEYLEEHDVPSRELINQSKTVLKRKGIVETLSETRRHFLRASMKKKKLAKRVLSFMEIEYSHDLTDFNETEAQMKAASEQLRNVELDMIKSMRATGFVDGEGDAVHLCDPPQISPVNVVVHSTQKTVGPLAKEKQRTYELVDVASMQRIQQTQIVPRKSITAPKGDDTSFWVERDSSTAPRKEDTEDFDNTPFTNPRPRPGKTYSASDAYRGPPKADTRQRFTKCGVYFDENDIKEDDEALSGKNMGTLPTHIIDDEEDEYGDLDINDEDMLDMAHPHHVFQETSGNRVRQQLGRDTSTQKPSTKSSTSTGPPKNQPQFPWTYNNGYPLLGHSFFRTDEIV